MPYEVFLSYSKVDAAMANAVCAQMEAKGLRCWIAPRDATPGRPWAEAIIDALNECRVMVLIFSQNSNDSQQVLLEVERAVHKRISVVTFRIESIVPTKSLELFLSTPHWLDAIDPPIQRHIERLTVALQSLLDLQRPEASKVSKLEEHAADQNFIKKFQEVSLDEWNRRPGRSNSLFKFFFRMIDDV